MIGIYKITNKINGKCYIGQSIDINRRLKEHFNSSRYNNSTRPEYNYKISIAIRKYGIDAFDTEIIEECDINELDKKEIYWIKFYDSYNNGYNSTLGGKTSEHIFHLPLYQYSLAGKYIKEYKNAYEASQETGISYDSLRKFYSKKPINKTAGGYQWSCYKYESLPDAYPGDPVLVFDFDGNYINFYESIEAASRATGDTPSIISKNCKDFSITGNYAQYRYWRNNPNLKSILAKKVRGGHKAVNQYNLDGSFIATFNSIKDAAEAMGCTSITAISACCNKNTATKSAYGYLWSFYGEEPIVYTKKLARAKTIIQLDLNDNYINEFPSARAAAKAIGQHHSPISNCCQNKRKEAYGYHWRYK